MKRKLFILMLAACSLLSCTDGIWNAIHGLEDKYSDLDARVAYLEELCSEMNTNISALQTLVSVILTNDYIISIAPITKDGQEIGYVITFAIHEPITIYHGQNGQDGADGKDGTDGKDGENGKDGADGKDGQDGTTPIIGVALDPTDNAYYWTLNGEWLLDENGNRIPLTSRDGQDGEDGTDGEDGKDGADGQNGKDGVTPQLKIEDGYWYVSTDNGATWTQLGKATGEDGVDGKDGQDGADGKDGQDGADGKDGQDGAKGEKGDPGDTMFQSVTQDDDFVYFTLADGTILMVPRGKSAPSEDDIIEFKDLEVKKNLLKLGIDTSHDGEITYREAAAFSGVISYADNTKIYSFKELKYFTKVSSINFKGCSNLFELELPDSLCSIDESAFSQCTSLSYIAIPPSVISINSYAFSGCTSLYSVKLSEGLTKIDDYAFQNCTSLDSITLPNSITEIGDYAFNSCNKLTTFRFPESLVSLGSKVHPSSASTIYWDVINFTDTYNLNSNTSYSNSTIKKVIFGKKVTVIPDNFCYNLDAITEIDIPNSVTQIGNSSFRDCGHLTTITLGNSLVGIHTYAFYN